MIDSFGKFSIWSNSAAMHHVNTLTGKTRYERGREKEYEKEREREKERKRERAEGGRKIERMGVTH